MITNLLQMYKIYINETPLLLLNDIEFRNYPDLPNKEVLKTLYKGKTKTLLQHIDMLEKTDRYDLVIIYHEEYERLVSDFMGLYKTIEAAGGLVTNEAGACLFIFRLGFWDLPKGKIDPGETIEAAAVREVEEETGIEGIVLGEKLLDTYHTYRTKKGKRVLKKTYWYAMQAKTQALTPQTEEDIELAVWMKKSTFFAEDRIVYQNILEVLRSGEKRS